MTTAKMITFLYLIELIDSGGNGDPDADNTPRTDPETGQAIATDVWYKRRIRDYVALTEGLSIYITDRAILANKKAEAYATRGLTPIESAEPESDPSGGAETAPADAPAATRGRRTAGKTPKASDYDNIHVARAEMCTKYWDIKTFGGVLSSKGPDCGQVRGPCQLTFSRSVDPVLVQRHSIDRIAVETVQESEKMGGRNHTMGGKYTIPHALLVGRGFILPHLFESTGLTEADLPLYWEGSLELLGTRSLRLARHHLDAKDHRVRAQQPVRLGACRGHLRLREDRPERPEPCGPGRFRTTRSRSVSCRRG